MDTKGETNTMEKTTSNLKADDFAVGDVSNFDLGDIFLRDNNFTPEYIQELIADKDMNKRLVRKIDLIILPMLAGTYMLQYIDKSALAYSAVFDLFTDTGISQDQYSWLASIFYFAYLAAEYPWSYLAQKTSLAKVVSGCVMSWGVVLMTTAACKNFAGLAVCRFLLGVFEAPITPCFMMIISMWCKSNLSSHTFPHYNI
jgi:sugar phosphate permease